MDTAEVVKELRTDNGLSQEEFAAKLGVVRQTVSRWEKGSAEPSLNDIKNMCRLFGIQPENFFEGKRASGGINSQSSAAHSAKCCGLSAKARAETVEKDCSAHSACNSSCPKGKLDSVRSVAAGVATPTLTADFIPENNLARTKVRRRNRKLIAATIVFIISLVLFVGMTFCTAVVGYTVFSDNRGFDTNTDFIPQDFIIAVLLSVLFLAVAVLSLLYRHKLKVCGER